MMLFELREAIARLRGLWIGWREGEEEKHWYMIAREFALSPLPRLSCLAYWDAGKRRWNVSVRNRDRILDGVARVTQVIQSVCVSAEEAADRITAVARALQDHG